MFSFRVESGGTGAHNDADRRGQNHVGKRQVEVGSRDRAIISVDERMPPRRQRFSIAHELGHWHHHRGRCLICRTEDIGTNKWQATDPERVADAYASDMLVPRYLLDPMLRDIPKPTLKAVRELASEFNTSLTAMVSKIIEANRYPLMRVCHGEGRRKWFKASASIPSRWFPNGELNADSFAFQVLFGGATEDTFPRRIGADAWFDRAGADRYEVFEQSYPLPNREIATMLLITDPGMLRE